MAAAALELAAAMALETLAPIELVMLAMPRLALCEADRRASVRARSALLWA